MRATHGGILRLVGNGFTNTGHVIIAEDASTVEIGSTAVATLVGGTLRTKDSGLIKVYASAFSALRTRIEGDVTLDVGSHMQLVANGGGILTQGTFTNNGLVEQMIGAGVRLTGDLTLTGTGVWKMQASPGAVTMDVSTGNEILINGANHTIEGYGTITGMTLDNRGLIDANATGKTLRLGQSTSGVVNNIGTVQASNGGILDLVGTHNNAGGVIQALNGSSIGIASGGSASLSGGILTTDETSVIKVLGNPGVATLTNITLSAGSHMRAYTGFYISGTMTDNGLVEFISGGSSLTDNLTLTGNGVFRMQLNPAALAITGNRTLINDAGHTIEGTGTLQSILIDNRGLIAANVRTTHPDRDLAIIQPSAGSVNSGTIRASAGARIYMQAGTFTNSGTFEALDGSLITGISLTNLNVSPGTLSGGTYRAVDGGSGATLNAVGTPVTTIAANTTVELSGAAPLFKIGGTNLAASLTTNAGKLKLSNDHEMNLGAHNYTQSASGSLQVEVASLTNVAKLTTTGSATLNGTLGILLGGGFTPAATDAFTILDAGSLSGMFANVANGLRLETLGAEGSFLVAYNNVAGTVVLSNYLAVALPGDFNGDGKVDAADYVVWRKNGLAPEAFNTWRAHFGQTGSSGMSTDAHTTVPEPATLPILLVGMLVIFGVTAERTARPI